MLRAAQQLVAIFVPLLLGVEQVVQRAFLRAFFFFFHRALPTVALNRVNDGSESEPEQ